MSQYILLTQIEEDSKKKWWASDKLHETVKLFDSFEEAKVAMRQAVSSLTKEYEAGQIALRNTPNTSALLRSCDRSWPFSEGDDLIDVNLQNSDKSFEDLNRLIINLVCDPEYVCEDIEALNAFDEIRTKYHIVIGNADCIVCSLNESFYSLDDKSFLRTNIHNMFDASKSYYYHYFGVNIRLINVDTISLRERTIDEKIVDIPDRIYFGNYMSNASGNKYAPLLWWVIKHENDKVLLISDLVIDYKQFSATCETSWLKSDLRKWLNSTFMDKAFTEYEKSLIYEYIPCEKITLLDNETSVPNHKLSTMATNYALKIKKNSQDSLPYNYHHPSRLAWWVKDTEVAGTEQTACYKVCQNVYQWPTRVGTATQFGGVRPVIWMKAQDLINLKLEQTENKHDEL